MDKLSVIVLLLIITLILHLAEEIKAGFRSRFPPGEMPRPVFISINTALYTFCFATLALSILDSDLAVPFAWAFAAAMLLNGAGHIGAMAVGKRYFPGGISAFPLTAISVYLVVHLATDI